MRSEAERPSRWKHRPAGFWSFTLAAALTVGMLGWQAWHLYDSYRAVSHRSSGDCPTQAIAAITSGSDRFELLLTELDHRVFVGSALAPGAWLDDWAARYDETRVSMAEALATGATIGKQPVRLAVEEVGTAVRDIDRTQTSIVGHLRNDDLPSATMVVSGPNFRNQRNALSAATTELQQRGREHLEDQLASERQQEMVSVAVSLGLFAMVAGSWVLYGRRLRKGRARLAEEAEQRRRTEIQLQQAQKMDALGFMAGGVAHTFNNLVMAISGSAAAAAEHLEQDHPALPAIHRIQEASSQGNNLIGGLLTFSRETSSSQQPVNLCELTHETADMLAEMLPDTIDCDFHCPCDGPLWTTGDRAQLQQAIVNVALNGYQAMPDGGELSLHVSRAIDSDGEGRSAVISVGDSGVGMDLEVQGKMFEPFFTTRPTGEGTGLGLSIVHGIVADHGGRVSVETARGTGTTVRLELPITTPPAAELDRSLVGHHRGDGIVLVASNHRHTCDLITGALTSIGFDVKSVSKAGDLAPAIEAAGSRLALLVTDDAGEAFESAATVAATHVSRRGAPVVMLTTDGVDPAPEDDPEVVVLRKPFTIAELRAIALELSLRTPAP